MKLENQVTNLELSKKLKELGVKQESYFYYWGKNNNSLSFRHGAYRLQSVSSGDFTLDFDYGDCISAFTVAELGEMLPGVVDGRILDAVKSFHKWVCYYSAMDDSHRQEECYPPYHQSYSDTEAEARAKMLIYLIENGLLKGGERE